MEPTALTHGERLKGTLIVLVWVALALGLREYWTAARTAPAGDSGQQVRAAPATVPSTPR